MVKHKYDVSGKLKHNIFFSVTQNCNKLFIFLIKRILRVFVMRNNYIDIATMYAYRMEYSPSNLRLDPT